MFVVSCPYDMSDSLPVNDLFSMTVRICIHTDCIRLPVRVSFLSVISHFLQGAQVTIGGVQWHVPCRPDISRFKLPILHVINHASSRASLHSLSLYMAQRKMMSYNVRIRKIMTFKCILAANAELFKSPRLLNEAPVLCTLFLACFRKRKYFCPCDV